MTFELCGLTLEADPSGALLVAEARVLIVADLHLEKGSGLAARGLGLIPPYDTAETLARLAAVIARYAPRTVVSLGDGFHDSGAPGRLDTSDAARLKALTAAADWIWLTGNHDPAPPVTFGGRVAGELALGRLTLRHAPTAGPAPGEIAGHLHPKASVRRRGRRLSRPCFASDGRRLVMPAFGAYTGGLNVLDAAFQPVFPGRFQAWLIGTGRLYRIASDALTA